MLWELLGCDRASLGGGRIRGVRTCIKRLRAAIRTPKGNRKNLVEFGFVVLPALVRCRILVFVAICPKPPMRLSEENHHLFNHKSIFDRKSQSIPVKTSDNMRKKKRELFPVRT